ncbi:hypothetical protein OF83DRAFT_1170153 [Amylostereum chailletii]|nr:hypothetical protein OF83DRAFT_1170153 [Amylostereum chailletii]
MRVIVSSTRTSTQEDDRLAAWASTIWPTYHLEVKATSSGPQEPFHMSRDQINTVRFSATLAREREDASGHRSPSQDVYVLIRAWDIRGNPSTAYRVYIDPVRHLIEGGLKMVSEDVRLMLDV